MATYQSRREAQARRGVAPSMIVREEIDERLAGGTSPETNILSALAQLGVRCGTWCSRGRAGANGSPGPKPLRARRWDERSATFRIDEFKHTVVVPGRGRIPVNVALTWQVDVVLLDEVFGDPHANRTG
jgi:hypothetical protein